MKRGVIILLALVLLSSSVFAGVVVLDTAVITTSSAELGCDAVLVGEGNLTRVEFWTDTAGTWAINVTDSTISTAIADVTKTITNIANGDYEWNCVFFNDSTSDAGNFTAVANGEFTINVAANTAPQFDGPIGPQNISEDALATMVFDLDDYFLDTDALTYSVSGNSSIRVTISDGEVTFLGAANWSGAETLTFTASDGSLTNTTNGVLITVNAVNDAPYLSDTIANVTGPMNSNITVDLDGKFNDIDTTTLGYTASDPSHITVYMNTDEATLVPEEDWFGNVTIIFYANDTTTVTPSNTVTIRITENSSFGDAPTIDTYLPLSETIKMKTTQSRTFEVLASDDGDNLTYKWQKGGVDISGATARTYKLENPSLENFTLKIIVSDGSLTATRSWNVEVRGEVVFDDSDLSVTTPSPIEDVESILSETTVNENVCGDGIKGPEETCSSCFEDVPCGSDQVCENSACVEKTGSGFAIALILGIVIGIGGIGFLIYRFNTHKQTFNDHRGGIRDHDRINITKLKEAPVSDVDDFYEKHKKSKPKAADAPDVKESRMEKYIKDMRIQGHSEHEIADKLKTKGWPEWQIDIALKKIK